MLIDRSVITIPETSLLFIFLSPAIRVVQLVNIICGEILYAELAYRGKFYVTEQKKEGFCRRPIR
jgi:hypothetical protein